VGEILQTKGSVKSAVGMDLSLGVRYRKKNSNNDIDKITLHAGDYERLCGKKEVYAESIRKGYLVKEQIGIFKNLAPIANLTIYHTDGNKCSTSPPMRYQKVTMKQYAK